METVRNGQKVWPYCSECGCRLEKDGSYYRHFGSDWFRDARGCKCSFVGMAWLPMNNRESIIITAFNRANAV